MTRNGTVYMILVLKSKFICIDCKWGLYEVCIFYPHCTPPHLVYTYTIHVPSEDASELLNKESGPGVSRTFIAGQWHHWKAAHFSKVDAKL